ncbi:hypothetical protein [Nostoc sp.]|uniref:hypothetical protein n=1 Tax=Nostoc sp. TaxID=1180 RepID=UPI002FF77E24
MGNFAIAAGRFVRFRLKIPRCYFALEPQLGKRGIYRADGDNKDSLLNQRQMTW